MILSDLISKRPSFFLVDLEQPGTSFLANNSCDCSQIRSNQIFASVNKFSIFNKLKGYQKPSI